MKEGYTDVTTNSRKNDIVFSKTIKAGKRIYYFDVKESRNGELFLAITESKKIFNDDRAQNFQFEKHKVFLYEEDFARFMDAMEETLFFIQENNSYNYDPNNLYNNRNAEIELEEFY